MQQKTLPRYIGGTFLLLAMAVFLGTSHVNSASSHTLTSVVQPASSQEPGPTSPATSMRGNSGTATPDTFSDLLLTGALVLLTLTLCVRLLLVRRRREQKQSHTPETDPVLPRVPTIGEQTPSAPLTTEEIPIANIPPPDASSRFMRQKNRLRAM